MVQRLVSPLREAADGQQFVCQQMKQSDNNRPPETRIINE